MLERLESPENVLAFKAVGQIEKDDYTKTLEPAVHAMLDARDELRVALVIGDEFDGYTMAAGWEDAKLGLGHVTKWKKFAVASDKEWVHHLLGMFRWMMPGDLELFAASEVDAAIAWAASE